MKTFRRSPPVIGKRATPRQAVVNNNLGGSGGATFGGGSPATSKFLLEDGVSYLLMEDGSKLLLE